MATTFKTNKMDLLLNDKSYSEEFPLLWQFPKEFKRNWFKQLDARFAIILTLTSVFEIAMVLSLLAWIKIKDRNIDVNSIQKQYAHLLLNKSGATNASMDDSMSRATYLYGIPEEIEPTAVSFENIADREENSMDNYPGNSKQVGSNTNGRGGIQGGQTDFSRTANSYGSGSAETIGSIGLLSYLSEDNNASGEELREIFAQGDRNIRYLEGSLANVKLTNFKGQGESSASGSEGTSYSTGLKGSKSNVSTAEMRSSVTTLEKANYSTVAKNTELEEFSESVLNKIGTKAAARKAEQVTKVILAHNRAIQDCYKQALKKHPDLRGKVVVRFSVTPDGRVDLVEVINSTIDDEPMLNCIVNRIRRWCDFGESDLSLGTVGYRQTYVFGY